MAQLSEASCQDVSNLVWCEPSLRSFCFEWAIDGSLYPQGLISYFETYFLVSRNERFKRWILEHLKFEVEVRNLISESRPFRGQPSCHCRSFHFWKKTLACVRAAVKTVIQWTGQSFTVERDAQQNRVCQNWTAIRSNRRLATISHQRNRTLRKNKDFFSFIFDFSKFQLLISITQKTAFFQEKKSFLTKNFFSRKFGYTSRNIFFGAFDYFKGGLTWWITSPQFNFLWALNFIFLAEHYLS